MKKIERIEIFGDPYSLRRTFDVIDGRGGSYGYDLLDSNNHFLKHYDIENKNDVIWGIKRDIYRISS